jgi:hypothetical protein
MNIYKQHQLMLLHIHGIRVYEHTNSISWCCYMYMVCMYMNIQTTWLMLIMFMVCVHINSISSQPSHLFLDDGGRDGLQNIGLLSTTDMACCLKRIYRVQSPWKFYVLHDSTRLHGATAQKTAIFVCTAIRTSNSTKSQGIYSYIHIPTEHLLTLLYSYAFSSFRMAGWISTKLLCCYCWHIPILIKVTQQ